jgi:hypothetical protein
MWNKNRTAVVAASLAIALIAGCATQVKTPTAADNPPPAEAFSKFSSFELKPINVTESCDKQHGGDVALKSIQEKLDVKLGGMVKSWNAAKKTGAASRKLIIEPVCSDVKLVGTAARIWGGALAGSSAVVMKVRFTDAGSGKQVAEPVFYQRANAMGAAYSFGATDRNMLDRLVDLISSYTVTNYTSATGGPTGL